MRRIYVYPKFSTLGAFGFRAGGPGLGNLFFPFARALILAKNFSFVPINPSWATMKLGPILRLERDARWYTRVFNPKGISGLLKTYLLLTRKTVTEEEMLSGAKPAPGTVVLTSGLRNYFKDIAHERDYLAGEFKNLLRKEDAEQIRGRGPYGIGVHVRLGDFPEHQRVPISWYVAMIAKIRQSVVKDVPVALASDGSDEELSELLNLPGVKRLNMSAAADMFALSSCKVILASDSTFSAWAAFLGRVPILWARRDPTLEGIFQDNTINEVLPADAELPPRLTEHLRRVLR